MRERFRGIPGALLLGFALLLSGCGGADEPADLMLLGGKIVTVDPDLPEVEALAARDGWIIALGSREEIERFRGPDTEVIELDGRLAIPGFIEGHGHFTGLGAALMIVRLGDARTWEEVVQRVATAAAEAAPGEWIYGRGWHQEKWEARPSPDVEGYPVHDALSRATPDNPVVLTHASGHASLANAKAMELAGIDASTADPRGGKILRDARGRATGVLRETAQSLVGSTRDTAEEDMSSERLASLTRRQIELADRECLSKGVTSFQDAGSTFETVDVMREMAEAGEISVRLWVMLRMSNERLFERAADYRIIDAADRHVTVRGIKKVIDGALGTHGAWLLEPYSDNPSAGLNTMPLEELEEAARFSAEHGFQLCVHAIGDRGNRETLDLFERYVGVGDGDARWRIEHAQHLAASDIPRFGELGVIASMQGVHCTSDAPWVPLRLGDERAEEGAYVWRKLIDSGAVIVNGTDVPVEDVDPLRNFHSTVSRRPCGHEPFYPDQAMTRMEALESSTINAAYAAFEEDYKGSLTAGKVADIVVLSRDILTVPEEEILDTEVVYTIVGGKVLHRP